jgi:hypothetical protein
MVELSFLYQTRTILRRKPRCRLRLGLQDTRAESTVSKNAPTQDDLDQVSFFRRKAKEVAAKVAQPIPNSLTPQERAAFYSLRYLAGQRNLNARLGIAPEPERLDTNSDHILALFTPQPQLEQSPSESVSDADASAENIQQVARDNEVEHVIHEICRSQLHSLAKLFSEALQSSTQPADHALWEVLETQVFPLLALLNSSQKPYIETHPDSNPSKHQVEAVAKANSNAKEKAAAARILPLDVLVNRHSRDKGALASVPPLKVLSRYYPAAILLALRLLTKNHPLSLQSHRLLPHLRMLGPSSYILGATAPFYNTHLLLRWSVYSSLSEVCSILAEMERSAVDFDRGTHRFLRDLADERSVHLRALQVDDGNVAESKWWVEDEQQKWWPQVEEWTVKVERALEERGMGVVRREGPEDGDILPFEGVSQKVWL